MKTAISRRILWSLLAMLLCAATAQAAWIEGENPIEKPQVDGISFDWSKEQPDLVAGGSLMHLNTGKLPDGGIVFKYTFKSEKGSHDVWLRVGYEYHRAPFSWRIDGGEWMRVDPLKLTTNVQCVAANQGSPLKVLGWLPVGKKDLSAGDHTIEIRIEKPENGPAQFMLDAICITEKDFIPNYRYKPGEDYRDQKARQASERIIKVPDSPLDSREPLIIDGLFEIAAWDPFEVDNATRLVGDKKLPELEKLPWYGIYQPEDRDNEMVWMDRAHRYILRTRFEISEAMAERGMLLDIQRFSTIASVFVNGEQCGWSKNAFTIWQCDLSRALKPGVNELCIVIRDSHYSRFTPRVSDKKPEERREMWELYDKIGHRIWWAMPRSFGSNGVRDLPVDRDKRSGLLSRVSLIPVGKVHVADSFVIPSVSEKKLTAQIEIENGSDESREVIVKNVVKPWNGGEPGSSVLSLPHERITVEPGEKKLIEFGKPWDDPKLWWPDNPNLYVLETSILVDRKLSDIKQTRFGFREIGWDSHVFTINGAKWQMWADTDYGQSVEDLIEKSKKSGMNNYRLWRDGPWAGDTRTDILNACDEGGMLVRSSGIFDGQMMNYSGEFARQKRTVNADGSWTFETVPNEALFDNWKEQTLAWIKAERGHPSVYIWSLENEVVYIAAHNSRKHDIVEPRVQEVADAVMNMDPTRPTMVDGGNCLRAETMPVNGAHYTEKLGLMLGDFPDGAYQRDTFYETYQRDAWRMVPGRPIMKGEVFFANGYGTDGMAWIGGDQCFQGPAMGRDARGLFARMLSEGWRWAEVSAWHFWMGNNDTKSYHTAWQPIAVLSRQWNWTFGSGEMIDRTLKVFNNTSSTDPIEVEWVWAVGGKTIDSDKQNFELDRGQDKVFEIQFKTPDVEKRTEASFTLKAKRKGVTVFEDVKSSFVIAPSRMEKPPLEAKQLAVYDPEGAVTAYLKKSEIQFESIENPDDLPESSEIIIVGPNAISEDATTDMRWIRLAAAGKRVIVLDQEHPLRHQAVPANASVSEKYGRIGFVENLQHPAFEQMDQPDFFCFGKGHLLYRNAYLKPTRGGRSLIQCDDRLRHSALIECPVGDGFMMLSQVAMGEKIADSGVAQMLLRNMLNYAAGYKRIVRNLTVCIDPADPRAKLIAELGLPYQTVKDPLEALKPGMRISIVEATPENLKTLADHSAAVKAFNEAGGWIMIWGLTPDGLKDYNRLVGHEHMLRPFRRERIAFTATRNPLMSGLTLSDIVMNTGKKVQRFSPMFMPVDDAFTWIVSHEDVAPFSQLPGGIELGKGEEHPGNDHNPMNLVNGLTDADHWKFGYTSILSAGHKPRISFDFPQTQELKSLMIKPGGSYEPLTKLRIHFSDGTHKDVDVEPRNEIQEFMLDNKKTDSLDIEILAWEEQTSPRDIVVIDNVWIKTKSESNYLTRTKPLLNIGGLMRYNRGKGGILLNQLNIKPTEQNPINAKKKSGIIRTLLANLGANFGMPVISGAENVAYQTIAIPDARYNEFPAEWKAHNLDLSQMPGGNQVMGSIMWDIANFQTSPIPGMIVQTDKQPVGEIKVDTKAHALYFLHAFNPSRTIDRFQRDYERELQRRAEGNKRAKVPSKGPAVARYMIRYTDGSTAEMPVRWLEDVMAYNRPPDSRFPARAAWTYSEDNAAVTVYYSKWVNPNPNKPIAGVDIYPAEGKTDYGSLALFAITAAQLNE